MRINIVNVFARVYEGSIILVAVLLLVFGAFVLGWMSASNPFEVYEVTPINRNVTRGSILYIRRHYLKASSCIAGFSVKLKNTETSVVVSIESYYSDDSVGEHDSIVGVYIPDYIPTGEWLVQTSMRCRINPLKTVLSKFPNMRIFVGKPDDSAPASKTRLRFGFH